MNKERIVKTIKKGFADYQKHCEYRIGQSSEKLTMVQRIHLSGCLEEEFAKTTKPLNHLLDILRPMATEHEREREDMGAHKLEDCEWCRIADLIRLI